MKKFILFALAAILLTGCVAQRAKKMNSLSVGMTKAQVIQVMGTPNSVSAENGTEYLVYRLATSTLDFDGSDTSNYFVQLVGGKVKAYGHQGDFDTTAMPKQRIQVDVKQH